jgi:hypothetical protein
MSSNAHNAKKYGRIVFGVPAFVPLILYLLFLLDFNVSGINPLLFENIEIFKRVFETKCSNDVLVWGYLFSILYLIFILPFMIARSKRIVFLGKENKNRTKAIWLLLATLMFSIFLFLNFVDYTSGSRKYAEVIKLSFYFWPLFYFYFLFPLYVSLMLTFAFLNTEIK